MGRRCLCPLVGRLTEGLSFLWTVSSGLGLGKALTRTVTPVSVRECVVRRLTVCCCCSRSGSTAALSGFDVPPPGLSIGLIPAEVSGPPQLAINRQGKPPFPVPLRMQLAICICLLTLHMDYHVSNKSNLVVSLPSEQQIGIGIVQPWSRGSTCPIAYGKHGRLGPNATTNPHRRPRPVQIASVYSVFQPGSGT